ncbi:TP901 family phage tail tape measure protein [Novosphingobium nitrogenifigens DSM 19370]|uniref:TP901 family phage tail tape measure protein n=1 Tax=Novosphingobium nitrogenifigens DSM 19370 TaxID=983920 RepID=F1Z9C8_9SPHN|nr:phage tail tape measure protein [Novosphingobium nitrogenifigens]EGD58377.1 TP901 family phage tail tape measure protein [Novosphingobium nitrogenifigens DSM 19370]
MADNKLNLVVRFNGIDDLSPAMKNIIGLGKTGKQVLNEQYKELRKVNAELKDYDSQISKATGNVDKLLSAQTPLILKQMALEKTIASQNAVMAINARTSKLVARGEAIKADAAQSVMGGVGLAAPLVLAGASAMDFGSGMVDIQQKAELTNAETAKMAGNIITLARAAHQLPEAMRSGVDVLAGMGLDPRQAVAMIGPIGRLGTAFKVDIADGANAAFANLNNLKIGLNETGRALDIMAAGGKAGAFEVRDMAQYFPALTAQARALGQQGLGAVADLTAALEIARRGTGDSATAANNLENLLSKINSKATVDAFQKNFGVNLPNALKRAYAEGKTPLEAIAEITKKATGGDLSKLSFAFEDMQAQGALRQLILDQNDYLRIRNQVSRQSSGTVDAAFRQRETQDPSVAWSSFKGGLSELSITMGQTLLPAATQFLRVINSMVSGYSRWAEANPKLAGALSSLVMGSIAAKIGLGALKYVAGSALGPVAKLWDLWSKYKELGSIAALFPRLASVLSIARLAVLGLGRGFLSAGAMMLANPMALIITGVVVAIGLLGYAVYRNWDKIKAAFTAGWEWLKTRWIAMKQWFTTLGSQMMDGLVNSIEPGSFAGRMLLMAKAGVAAVRSHFVMHSPSRLMMEMGGHIATGLALGVDQHQHKPVAAMRRMSQAMSGTIHAPARGTGSRAPAPVTLHIHQQPGENAEALARRVLDLIDRRTRVRALGAY